MKFIKELKQNITFILTRLGLITDQLSDIYDLLKNKKETDTPSLLVIARHSLGSIDISDITNPDNKPQKDYAEYTAQAAQFYNFFKQEAEWMMKLQHDYWFTQADGENQMYFGRGTMNGIQLLLQRFEKLKDTHLENIKPKEEPPLGSRESILAKLQVGSDDPIDEVKE